MENALNPESTVLQQVDGHWQKLFAILLWKFAKRDVVVVKDTDIEAMAKEFAPCGPIVFTHGQVDGFRFSLVTEEKAKEIAAFDAMQRGTA